MNERGNCKIILWEEKYNIMEIKLLKRVKFFLNKNERDKLQEKIGKEKWLRE